MKTPKLSQLIEFSKECQKNYQECRETFDSQRFFSSILPSTKNQDRLHDISFINKVAVVLEKNKVGYPSLDNKIGKNYDKDVAPFFKRVLSGVLFLELNKITKTYRNEHSVKNNSALGKLILDLFEIDALSDIPAKDLNQCLNDLSQFIDVANKEHKKNNPIQWHTSMSNEELKTFILNSREEINESEEKHENVGVRVQQRQ